MFVNLLFFTLGLLILYFGAEWLVKGAASLAINYGIRPLIVGITVVALATSMPEFVVNLVAAVDENDNLALGNIIGSNICNIALILGISAMVLPLKVEKNTLKKEYSIMMATMVTFYLVSLDGTISQIDGIFLVSGLAAFLIYLIRDSRRRRIETAQANDANGRTDALGSNWKRAGLILIGMIGLSLGARIMVNAAVDIAESMNISPIIVGLTVVAIGTSLPELAASVAAALNKEADMSVGNVLGSNLLNVLFVVGLVSIIHPLSVDDQNLTIHFPVMIGFCVLLLPLAWTRYQISRIEGAILLVGFFGYIAFLVNTQV